MSTDMTGARMFSPRGLGTGITQGFKYRADEFVELAYPPGCDVSKALHQLAGTRAVSFTVVQKREVVECFNVVGVEF